jgi:hypothetical protein
MDRARAAGRGVGLSDSGRGGFWTRRRRRAPGGGRARLRRPGPRGRLQPARRPAGHLGALCCVMGCGCDLSVSRVENKRGPRRRGKAAPAAPRPRPGKKGGESAPGLSQGPGLFLRGRKSERGVGGTRGLHRLSKALGLRSRQQYRTGAKGVVRARSAGCRRAPGIAKEAARTGRAGAASAAVLSWVRRWSRREGQSRGEGALTAGRRGRAAAGPPAVRSPAPAAS